MRSRSKRSKTRAEKSATAPEDSRTQLYSIGHSTRSLEELVQLLRVHGVKILADIRTLPGSRRNPQFNQEALSAGLSRAGIQYAHLPRLGGLRKGARDSPNGAWRNASFRAFADYMSTEEFDRGLEELGALMDRGSVALMCAEAVPWRCHRSLIADALLARGITVRHIVGSSPATPHRMTPFAVVDQGRVTYPATDQSGTSAKP